MRTNQGALQSHLQARLDVEPLRNSFSSSSVPIYNPAVLAQQPVRRDHSLALKQNADGLKLYIRECPASFMQSINRENRAIVKTESCNLSW